MNASGRDDTALANAVLNGVATMLSVCAAYHGCSLDELTEAKVLSTLANVRLGVCGDDSLGMLPRWDAARLLAFKAAVAANIREFGFNAKLETSTRIEECVFLGMRPYPVGGQWYWGKTIGRATYKMGWSLQPQLRDVMAHITGIADMHVKCSSHVPILADLALKICELRQGAKRTPVCADKAKPWEWTLESGVAYDDSTLQCVATLYGVTVADVRELIGAIHRVERLPAVIDSGLWRRIISMDEL